MVDLSADFRLRSVDSYAQWYGGAHKAPELQAEAVYGLTEIYREQVRTFLLLPLEPARMHVACPCLMSNPLLIFCAVSRLKARGWLPTRAAIPLALSFP